MTPNLTPAQQSAVLSVDGDSSILAGAGSGKTTVLVEKVTLLVEKLHVRPEEILVVTFTEKAAEELKQRLTKRLSAKRACAEALPIGTIHAFAADCIRRFADSLDMRGDFCIMTESLARLEQIHAVRHILLSLIESENSEAIDAVERFGLKRALRFFLDLLQKRSIREDPLEEIPYLSVITSIRERFQTRKKELNLLDFDDLEDKFLQALNHSLHPELRWIIVDEFQDTSPIQWKILSKLQELTQARLVIVGDPRQSIYRFRGADPSLFQTVTNRIESQGGRLFYLSENFRSTPSVINFVNETSRPLFREHFPPLLATRKDNGLVEQLTLPSLPFLDDIRQFEAKLVLERLQALRQEGHLWKSMALLFKTRRAVTFYEPLLREMQIPYQTSLGEPLLERPEIISLIFLLKKLQNPTETEKTFIETGLQQSPLKEFQESLSTEPLSAFLSSFFEKTKPFFPNQLDLNFKSFQSLLEDLMTLGITDLPSLIRHIDLLREEEARINCPPPASEASDALHLMTIHASKGLEFPIVVLCDLCASPPARSRLFLETGNGSLLLKDQDSSARGLKHQLGKSELFERMESKEKEEELEESKRLLYVALTRAKDRLILPLPDKAEEKDGKSRKKRVGRWSDWLIP